MGESHARHQPGAGVVSALFPAPRTAPDDDMARLHMACWWRVRAKVRAVARLLLGRC